MKEWKRITKCSAVIEAVDPIEGVAIYIAKKNLPWEKSELIVNGHVKVYQLW